MLSRGASLGAEGPPTELGSLRPSRSILSSALASAKENPSKESSASSSMAADAEAAPSRGGPTAKLGGAAGGGGGGGGGQRVASPVTPDWLQQAEDAQGAADVGAAAAARGEDAPRGGPSLPDGGGGGGGGAESGSFTALQEFDRWRREPDLAIAVAAIKALTAVIRTSEAATLMGLEIELRHASAALKARNKTLISVSTACDLFMRYVTRTSMPDHEDLPAAKAQFISRGEQFGQISLDARQKIAELGAAFVHGGSVVLTHGFSRVVLALFRAAATRGTHFSVILTEARPDNGGAKMAAELVKVGVPVTIVLDSAVGYMMERCDMVLVGADGVVESGGIINTLGTFQVAVVGREMNKPVYVAAEAYKFARMYPLDQRDLEPSPHPVHLGVPLPPSVTVECTQRDYTPPKYLTLLFTNLGILTPSAVSDELIKLYQ